MVSAFTTKNNASFIIAKSFLEKEKISFIPKGENLAGLEYTSFEIFVREEDYERVKILISEIEDNNVHLQEQYNKKHNPFFGVVIITAILIAIALLFVLGIWLRGTD
ncbi:MAG: DUF2007 domain-containing protein [Ignavibacteria bacterium]|jgi:hypothetical protein|nr:DUF2007 domain-containing protein [Ignavibacteria bacterium]